MPDIKVSRKRASSLGTTTFERKLYLWLQSHKLCLCKVKMSLTVVVSCHEVQNAAIKIT